MRRQIFTAALAILALVLGSQLVAVGSTASGATETYIVLYQQQAVPANAAATIARAGGTLVYAYGQIGVAIARSSSSTFRTALLALDRSVQDASATTRFAVQLHEDLDASGPPGGDLANAPATDADTFSAFQWDMSQISAQAAHAITGGSPSVIVGDIDTGLDFRHPDLAANIDFVNSVSCIDGVPNQAPSAWDDGNGHGTHTAGTIAAAANGIGIVGVAPNVRIAAIKTGTDEGGFFFPEAVVCAFMWAGSHHLDVTNNSYFADPYLFNCHNDATQRAIWIAEYRAIRYAITQGVTVVAAEGNFSDDLAHPTQDIISPDTGPGETRTVHNDCVVIPTEIPGVIGVSATGSLRQKSFYSNYGVGVTEVAAPGGDSRIQPTTDPGHGRVLSTWAARAAGDCSRQRQEPTTDPNYPIAYYCWAQGTSMASPHVAGLAALVISRYGDAQTPQNGKLRPDQVAAIIQQTADPTPCPADVTPYAPFPSISNDAPQQCTGGTGYNSWYGNGIVNALSAITHMSSSH